MPVVVMTSSKEQRDMVEGYHLGVNSYIQKPVDFDEFRNLIRQLGFYWLVVNQAPPDAAFQEGGFNGTIISGFSNPLAGKRGWCSGTIGQMTRVTVNLGALGTAPLQLRWHEGDDESGAATGWYVDSVTVANVSAHDPRAHRARHVCANARHPPDARGEAIAFRVRRIAHGVTVMVNTVFR
jgi:CheY-like chemotaxis protein